MKRFIEGANRQQITLLSESLDEYSLAGLAGPFCHSYSECQLAI